MTRGIQRSSDKVSSLFWEGGGGGDDRQPQTTNQGIKGSGGWGLGGSEAVPRSGSKL